MKLHPKRLLLIDSDRETADLITLACARTGHTVVHALTSREAFAYLGFELDTFDAVLIDLEAGVHGPAVLEDLHLEPDSPPLITLTDPADCYLSGLAAVRGAAARLTKPVTAAELARTIEEVTTPAWRAAAHTCDPWGHPLVAQHAVFVAPGWHRPKTKAPTAADYAMV